MKKKKTILVYGTLRKGMGNHIYLKDAEFLGYVKLTKHKIFVDTLPYLVKTNSKDDYALCEKYKVTEDEFKNIERLEGFPAFYVRKKIRGSYIYYYKPYYKIKDGTLVSDYMKYSMLDRIRSLEYYIEQTKYNLQLKEKELDNSMKTLKKRYEIEEVI